MENKIALVSSNRKKLEAFAALGLPMELKTGVDLPEVDGTPDEVAIRKSEAAGPGTMVEDTILEVNGKPIVDIRWHINQLDESDGACVLFIVTLAVNDGHFIRLWRGEMPGTLGLASDNSADAFGFDPYVYPDGADGLSLHELAIAGRTAEFSARARAVSSYLRDPPFTEVLISNIEPWNGGWQHSEFPVAKPR